MPVPVLQREYDMLRREYEAAAQKLTSTMNSIKTFWSPELKRERALRKEENSKNSMISEQLRLATQETQKQQLLTRQLQGELQAQYDIHRTIRDADVQSVSRDEYDALRLERDRLHRELQLARDTVRELEVQIETQRQTLLSRDESVKKLLDMLQSKGMLPYNAAQERIEYERTRVRTIELENRCRYLENTLQQKELDLKSLQEECLNASEKIRQLQQQYEWLQKMPTSSLNLTPSGGISSSDAVLKAREDSSALFQSLIDSKETRITNLEKQLQYYEDEVKRLRDEQLRAPRDFTDKTVTNQEYQEMKLKMEKSELELSHKHTELLAFQTRLTAAEDQVADLKKHLTVVKQTSQTKEQQMALLQGDIEALRSKLETKNDTLEQKQQQLNTLQQDKSKQGGDVVDLKEQLKIAEGKLQMAQRKMNGLEDVVKEKERELEALKQRMQALPAMQQQRQLQDQLDEAVRERERLQRDLREQRETAENEKLEQLDAHRRATRDLRTAIESLEKDIADRQVLIESQNEKISELTRELQHLRVSHHGNPLTKADSVERVELDRVRDDLHLARSEVDRLLKIVQNLEAEKDKQSTRVKELERQLDETRRKQPFSSTPSLAGCTSSATQQMAQDDSLRRRTDTLSIAEKDRRIDELEEALRESVSITAERELAIAQQKQLCQQMEQRMTQYKDQTAGLQRQYEETNTKMVQLQNEKLELEQQMRLMRQERRKHLEDVLRFKQEALLAAISEKDAHIAVLEASRQDRNAVDSPRVSSELETLRRHKEKLMRKLKEENEKRMAILNEQKSGGGGMLTSQSPGVLAGGATTSVHTAGLDGYDFTSSQLAKDLKASPVDQVIHAIRWVELQKKKLRLFIDQMVASILEFNPDLLNGLPRTQQEQRIFSVKTMRLWSRDQLLIELHQRELDSLQLQHYAHQLLQRMSQLHPSLVRRALRLLDSFDSVGTVFPQVPVDFRAILLNDHHQNDVTIDYGADGPLTRYYSPVRKYNTLPPKRYQKAKHRRRLPDVGVVERNRPLRGVSVFSRGLSPSPSAPLLSLTSGRVAPFQIEPLPTLIEHEVHPPVLARSLHNNNLITVVDSYSKSSAFGTLPHSSTAMSMDEWRSTGGISV